MSVSLSNDDRCAVDLLLEHAQPPTSEATSCFTKATSADMQARLERAEGLLHTLDHFLAAEPPADLVANTLARCERLSAVQPANPDSSRPIATAR